MPASESPSREELYAHWLAWVVANLRDDPRFAPIAANAGADAAARGEGFNAAAAAATNAFIKAAGSEEPLWRPGFWKLLLTDRYFWGLAVLLVTVPLYWVAPALIVLAVLIPPALIVVGWKAHLFWRLSRHGIVAPGSMFDVRVKDSDGAVYTTTYSFDYQGRHFVSRMSRQTTPEVVYVLFDPRRPKSAMVMPELLNPGA